MNDNSTFGGFHSVGSDLTRTQAKSKSDQTGPSKDQERGSSPTSRPVVGSLSFFFFQRSFVYLARKCNSPILDTV